jgi:hypothetical protein
VVNGKQYYLPFEFEPVSQRIAKGTVTPWGRIGAWFTVISLVRSYIIRRWFNARLHSAAQAMARAAS